MLKTRFLGEPKIHVEGKDITNLISSKGIGILAYLLSQRRGTKIHREKISALFWSESDHKSAKYNLRYTLWSIKKILKDYDIKNNIIVTTDKSYCFIDKEADLECDLENFKSMAEQILNGNFEGTENFIKVYNGKFLQGIQIKDNRELDDWIIYQMEKLQRIYLGCLRKLSENFSNLGEYKKGIEYLEQILFMNPLDEETHRALIKLYYVSGNRVAAMKQYEKCRNILRDELNISPMEETTKLYKNIKDDQLDRSMTMVLDKEYKCIPYFILSEMIELVLQYYPNILNNIEINYKIELAKILPAIRIHKNEQSLHYLSVDIEKLRIFRAGAEVLKNCIEVGELPTIKICGEIDQTSSEFLQYIERKFPEIWIKLIVS